MIDLTKILRLKQFVIHIQESFHLYRPTLKDFKTITLKVFIYKCLYAEHTLNKLRCIVNLNLYSLLDLFLPYKLVICFL